MQLLMTSVDSLQQDTYRLLGYEKQLAKNTQAKQQLFQKKVSWWESILIKCLAMARDKGRPEVYLARLIPGGRQGEGLRFILLVPSLALGVNKGWPEEERGDMRMLLPLPMNLHWKSQPHSLCPPPGRGILSLSLVS